MLQEVVETIGMVQHLRRQVQEARLEQQSKRTRNAVLQAAKHRQGAEIQQVTERCHILKQRCHSVEDSTLGVDCVQVLGPDAYCHCVND